MHRYRATLAYDGTDYFGWQKTKEGPSIQETLAQGIHIFSPNSPLPEAASRTDRGVHAEGQVVSIDIEKPWESELLLRALNAHLPPDIRLLSLDKTASDFHPTLHAVAKEYRYRLCLSSAQDPTHRLYSWAFRFPLNLMKIQKTSFHLLGTHDFSALANADKENPICTLYKIDLQKLSGNRLEIVIAGNRFLYKMVRNIVGTLLYIGCGKLEADCIPDILLSKDRKQAGVTAPAHGLTLYSVQYCL